MTELVILHTNDLHAHFQNWKTQVSWIQKRKAVLEAEGKAVWVIDLGDFSDRVHPLMEATNSGMTTPLLTEMGVDMVTIGNNEGLANTPAQITAMYQAAPFDVLCSNVKELKTQKLLSPLKSFQIKEVNGKRIGVFGLTAPFPHCYEPNGLLVEPFEKIVPSILKELDGKVDGIICLSHLGMYDDAAMADSYPELTVILGAHTHHIFPTGKIVGSSFLTGGGKHGRYVGELTLDMSGDISVIEERLIDLEPLRGAEDELFEQDLYHMGQKQLELSSVTMISQMLSIDTLTQLSLDAMCEAADCEVAFSYTGLFLKSLSAGAVTALDLHECMPHPIHLNRCRLRVKDFIELLNTIEMERDRLETLEIMGRGFRGKIFGKIFSKGYSISKGNVCINGSQLQESDWVTFVCPDHMRFVDYFPMIREKGENEILYPNLLRQVMAEYLRKGEMV